MVKTLTTLIVLCGGLVICLAYRRRGRGIQNQAVTPSISCRVAPLAYRAARLYVFFFAILSLLSNEIVPMLGFHESARLRWLGVIIASFGVLAFMWAMRTLGEQYRPCSHAYLPTRLVTSGPYRWVRHPIYSANLLYLTGLAITVGSAWLLMPLAAFSVIYFVHTRREEADLVRRFPEYADYMANSGRFLPTSRVGF